MVTVSFSRAELNAFLEYFYYVEGLAQGDGHNTSKHWKGLVVKCHDKLMAASRK